MMVALSYMSFVHFVASNSRLGAIWGGQTTKHGRLTHDTQYYVYRYVYIALRCSVHTLRFFFVDAKNCAVFSQWNEYWIRKATCRWKVLIRHFLSNCRPIEKCAGIGVPAKWLNYGFQHCHGTTCERTILVQMKNSIFLRWDWMTAAYLLPTEQLQNVLCVSISILEK